MALFYCADSSPVPLVWGNLAITLLLIVELIDYNIIIIFKAIF